MLIVVFLVVQELKTLLSQIHIDPESGVELPADLKKHLHSHSFGRPSRFVRKLVHILFPNPEELANSSCLGQKTGDHASQALDAHRVAIIKGQRSRLSRVTQAL